MAKKVIGQIKLQLPGGRLGEPILRGPQVALEQLGPRGGGAGRRGGRVDRLPEQGQRLGPPLVPERVLDGQRNDRHGPGLLGPV